MHRIVLVNRNVLTGIKFVMARKIVIMVKMKISIFARKTSVEMALYLLMVTRLTTRHGGIPQIIPKCGKIIYFYTIAIS